MIPLETLAAVCADAYAKPADLGAPGLHVRFTRGYGDRVIVAFRGSADQADWIQNFDFREIRVTSHPKLGLVPQGLLEEVIDLYTPLRQGATATGRTVIIGHSRGGSQAHGLAALLAADGIPVEQVVTFGAARVGTLNDLILHQAGADVINGDDPVPNEPFWIKCPRPSARQYIGRKRSPVPMLVDDHYIASYRRVLTAQAA